MWVELMRLTSTIMDDSVTSLDPLEGFFKVCIAVFLIKVIC